MGAGGCSNDCSGNGVCEIGVCQCREGFQGIDCSQRVGNQPRMDTVIGSSLMRKVGPALFPKETKKDDASLLEVSSNEESSNESIKGLF